MHFKIAEMVNALFCPAGEDEFGELIGLRLVNDRWIDRRVLGAYRSREDAEYVGNFLVSWLRDAAQNGIKLTDDVVDNTFRNAHDALKYRRF